MEYLVHSLRYTMSGRRLEAVELPEAPSQRKSGHIVLVEHLCATALGHVVLVEHLCTAALGHIVLVEHYEALGQFVLVEHHGALIVEHKSIHISILLMCIVEHF